MRFGNYDEQEHKKREAKLKIDMSEETSNAQHDGKITTEGGEDTDALLEHLATLKHESQDTG